MLSNRDDALAESDTRSEYQLHKVPGTAALRPIVWKGVSNEQVVRSAIPLRCAVDESRHFHFNA